MTTLRLILSGSAGFHCLDADAARTGNVSRRDDRGHAADAVLPLMPGALAKRRPRSPGLEGRSCHGPSVLRLPA